MGSHTKKNHFGSRTASFPPLAPQFAMKSKPREAAAKIYPLHDHKHAGITVLLLIITLVTVVAFALSKSEDGMKTESQTLSLVTKTTLE